MATIWRTVDRGAEGLEILEDGTLRFSALRAQKATWIYELSGSAPYHLISMTARKIRLSIAIPMDHTIRAAYKVGSSPGAMPTGGVGGRVDDIAHGPIRQHYTQAGETFKNWLRKDSWGIPESIPLYGGGVRPKLPDKLGSTLGTAVGSLRCDIEPLNEQAKRRLMEKGRVGGEKPIILKGICLDWTPGDFVASIGGVFVGKCVKAVNIKCGNGPQFTELILC